MSIEDRVRDATRARADLVHRTRPLDLPLELPARRSARARRDRGRRWVAWSAPVAAAALVTALALILVVARQAGRPHSAPAAPGGGPPAAASVPRYYAALAGATSRMHLVVGDDQTGRTLAVINPPAGQSFYGVTGAADDRTFVVASATSSGTSWYLLRLSPGTAHPAQLTSLPVKPIGFPVTGLALSPDGQQLAVMYHAGDDFKTGPGNKLSTQVKPTYLVVFSMSSGAVLHTWGNRSANGGLATGANGEGLSWVDGDRSLDFGWGIVSPFHSAGQVRTIDLTATGQDLLGSSRVTLTDPAGTELKDATGSSSCASSLAAPDGTIVCGTYVISDARQDACAEIPPSLVTYSGTTGKQLEVLYQYRGHCMIGGADVLWTDAGGRHVITLLVLQVKGDQDGTRGNKFGLVSDGRFTPLKLVVGTVAPTDARDDPGGFAF